MSTLGSLYALLGQNMPQTYATGLSTVLGNESQETRNQTDLLKLAELQRAQETEARMRAFYQQHPELALGGGMQSTLGGGGMPPGPPGGAPLMQQPFGGGQPPGAPQVVPGGQDLSRFATQGAPMPDGPPMQSTLGGPGPQQGQGPANPLLDLVRRDPAAGMAIQARMEKMQEGRMQRTVQETEYVGRILQSVKDDASYGPAKAEIARVLPQYAAQLPATYSKEAIQPYIDRAVSVGEKAKWDLDVAKALKATEEAKLLPKMFEEIGQGGTSAGTSAAPAATGTAWTTPATSRPVAAPAEYESAITEATRLYPQVKPERIKAIIAAESNFDAKAVSPAGAKGPMQLMDATAHDMGVEDPFNVQQNVRGGTRYYAQLLTKYGGDERKALAAYNWGPGNLDKVGGDVSKAPPETQAYVAKVLGGGGGGGTGTAQAPAANPRIAELEALIKRAEVRSQQASVLGNESWATQLNNQANRLAQERNRLQDEDRRLQERREEIPRAVAKEQELQPLKIAQQEAGARIQNEAKMNEPIGAENAIKMNLDPQTRWKDVPKGTRVLDRPGEGVINKFGDYAAAHEGLGRVMSMLEKPGARSIIGTLLSEPDASFRRRAGEWISSVTPEERKFTAALVGEIATIRNTISGQAVTPQESQFLAPMLPSVSDPDVATVRAKLEALQDWVANKHNNYRNQQDQMGFRTPKALARTAETPPAPKTSTAVDRARDIMKPR